MHVAVGQDAREHGERGGRHRRPEEQHERERVAVGVLPGQGEGEQRAEHERHDGGAEGDARRDLALAPYQLLVELQPDHEHEQDQPDVGEGGQRGPHVGSEQVVADPRAEQRRPEQDAGHDLADHRGLAETLRQRAEKPRGGEHDYKIKEQHIHVQHRTSSPQVKTL